MLIKYKVSKKEVVRRQKAFLSLSIFLIIGLFWASKIFKVHVFGWIYITYFLILLISNLWINKFFKSFLKTKIGLSKQFLTRISEKRKEKFLIKNIKKIKIKRTTNNSIREMSFYFKNGKSIFINGLGNFAKFKINIIKKANKNVIIKDIREPIDFDSIFFYPILGLLLSFGTVYLFKWLISLDYNSMRIFFYIAMVYSFGIMVFLTLAKPIAKRYGGHDKLVLK